MKRILSLVVALLATMTGNAQKPYRYCTEQWNGTNWDSLYVNTYTYNAQFHTLADDQVDFDGTAWVNALLNTYTNNVVGNPTLQLGQQWNTGLSSWENSNRVTTTYSANTDKQLSIVNESWNGTNFDNTNRDTYSYDANGYLINLLTETWNGSGWDNSAKISFTNDANGAPTGLLQQQWNGTGWDDFLRGTMTNTLNKPLTGTYDFYLGSWAPIFKYTNSYDASMNLTSQLFEFHNGSAWENSQLSTSFYDATNNNTLTLIEFWDPNMSDWAPDTRTTAFFYATNPAVKTITVNNVTQVSATADASVSSSGGTTVSRGICFNIAPTPLISDQNVPSGTGTGAYTAILSGLAPNTTYYARAYATNSVTTVYGEEISFTTDLDVGFDPTQFKTPFRVYPQPAADVLNIQSAKSTVSVIYDLNGRPIQEININSGTTTIDVSKLAPGVYLLGEKANGVRFIKQ